MRTQNGRACTHGRAHDLPHRIGSLTWYGRFVRLVQCSYGYGGTRTGPLHHGPARWCWTATIYMLICCMLHDACCVLHAGDVGRHFRVSTMLSRDVVKSRMGDGAKFRHALHPCACVHARPCRCACNRGRSPRCCTHVSGGKEATFCTRALFGMGPSRSGPSGTSIHTPSVRPSCFAGA